MRLLGLDVGEKTIGLAVSDAGGVLASPLRTLLRSGGERDLELVAEVVAEAEAEALVLGLPLGLDGREGVAARRARRLGAALSERLDCPVHYWDERFSTVAAERALLEADVSRARRKRVVDHVAAAIILQGWLDARAHADCAEETSENLT